MTKAAGCRLSKAEGEPGNWANRRVSAGQANQGQRAEQQENIWAEGCLHSLWPSSLSYTHVR